jgi:hypothetical protein
MVEKYHRWSNDPEIMRLTATEPESVEFYADLQKDYEKDPKSNLNL